MLVIVNSQPKQFPGKSISELVHSLNMTDTNGVALAVNDKVIPKADWKIIELKEKDRITIIKATQGG